MADLEDLLTDQVSLLDEPVNDTASADVVAEASLHRSRSPSR